MIKSSLNKKVDNTVENEEENENMSQKSTNYVENKKNNRSRIIQAVDSAEKNSTKNKYSLSNWKDFWASHVQTKNFTISPVEIFFDKNTGRKKINKKGGNDYEITFEKGSGHFMLDFDCADKSSQAEFFERRESMVRFLKNTPFYLERTVSGGYHLFVTVEGANVNSSELKLEESSGFAMELKTKCCIWPSKNYSVIKWANQPNKTPINLLFYVVLNSFILAGVSNEDMFRVYTKLSNFFNAPSSNKNFETYLKKIQEKNLVRDLVPYSENDMETEENCEDGEDVEDNGKDNEDVTGEYGDKGGENGEAVEAVEGGDEDGEDGGEDASDNEGEVDNGGDDSDGSETSYVNDDLQSSNAPQNTTFSPPAQYWGDVFPDGDPWGPESEPEFEDGNAKKGKYLEKDLFIPVAVDLQEYEINEEEYAKAKPNKNLEVGLTNELLMSCKKKPKMDENGAVIDAKTILHKIFIKRILQRITEKLFDEYDSKAAECMLGMIITNYMQIENSFFGGKGSQKILTIYGDDIRIFLEHMICTDDQIHTKSKNDYIGVFSSLSEFKVWNNWVLNYCQLIATLELRKATIGKNSKTKIHEQEFEMYRMVTLRNSVGGRHDDAMEKREYFEKKKEATEFFFMPLLDERLCFIYFIFTTLACINLSKEAIIQFDQFKNFLVARDTLKDEPTILKKILFDIKLRNISFRIMVFGNDSDKGDMINNAYFWIQNLYLHNVKSEFFEKLMKKLFPNTDNLTKIRENLANKMLYENENETTMGIKKWCNMFPFVNGVFDFYGPVDARYPENTGKESLYEVIGPSKFSALTLEDTVLEKRSYFRNYHFYDGVTEPIKKNFDIDLYLETFNTTNLLSLDNEIRYSKDFCLLMKGTFGNSPEAGNMGPYNYENFISLMFMVSLGLLRTNLAQTAIILYGKKGANGKSEFIKLFESTFGLEKFSKINAEGFFSEKDINQQTQNLQETMGLYGNDVKYVNNGPFKDMVCGGVLISRGIYKNVDRTYNFINACYMLSSNDGLDYKTKNKPDNKDLFSFDSAFLRRCFVINFFNHFRQEAMPRKNKKEKVNFLTLLMQEKINLADSKTQANLRRGLLYYILDMIHVFDLSHLEPTVTDCIMCPLANQRVTGCVNYDLLKYFCDHYVLKSESGNEHTENLVDDAGNKFFENTLDVDMQDMITDMRKSLHNANLSDICEIMTRFGLNIEKCFKNGGTAVMETESDFIFCGAKTSEDPSGKTRRVDEQEISISESKYRYIVKDVVRKIAINPVEDYIRKFPHKNNLIEILPKKEFEDFETAQDFVEYSIPYDHRFIVHDLVAPKYFDVISKLLRKEKVTPLLVPKKDEKYTSITSEDFLRTVTKNFLVV